MKSCEAEAGEGQPAGLYRKAVSKKKRIEVVYSFLSCSLKKLLVKRKSNISRYEKALWQAMSVSEFYQKRQRMC
jgi:hypothetical protein